MTDRALEHLRNAKGRERKAITEAAIRAVEDWLDGQSSEVSIQQIARAMHDCGIDPKKTARMRDEQREGTA